MDVWEWGTTQRENYFEEDLPDIKNLLSENLKKIAYATGRDRATEKTKRIVLNDDISVAIALFIRDIKNAFHALGFQIYFTSWEQMKAEHFPLYTLKMV